MVSRSLRELFLAGAGEEPAAGPGQRAIADHMAEAVARCFASSAASGKGAYCRRAGSVTLLSVGARAVRETVDLSGYPDLVVIYLGMRVNAMHGLRTLAKTGARIRQGVAAGPEGLLRHEYMLLSLVPPHLGMRQYWRDFDSLERWARSDPHRAWWSELLADPAGTGFWHETYFSRGGVEAIYLDLAASPLGLGTVAPRQQARKSMFSARSRLGVGEPGDTTPAMSEQDVYGDSPDRPS